MVGHKIQQQLHASEPDLPQQLIKIIHAAKDGLNGSAVAVTSYPKSFMGEIQMTSTPQRVLQVVQPRSNAFQVTDSIAIGVLKGSRIDLVNDRRRVFPPHQCEMKRKNNSNKQSGKVGCDAGNELQCILQLESRISSHWLLAMRACKGT